MSATNRTSTVERQRRRRPDEALPGYIDRIITTNSTWPTVGFPSIMSPGSIYSIMAVNAAESECTEGRLHLTSDPSNSVKHEIADRCCPLVNHK